MQVVLEEKLLDYKPSFIFRRMVVKKNVDLDRLRGIKWGGYGD